MNIQRVRAFAVTVAVVLGAGTVSAVAAPMIRGAAPVRATQAVSETPTATVAEPTEPVSERGGLQRDEEQSPEADEQQGDAERDAARKPAKQDARERGPKAGPPAHAAAGKPAKTGKPDQPGEHGRGNAHGKAVSKAARGETAPVGDCRNHGHWVSTVAKGKASCDDNPRPAGDDAEEGDE